MIGGEGLSQDMSTDEMTALLEQACAATRHTIPLDGLVTDHLRVECDREHPVWPNHGECNGGPFNVPFALLDPLEAFGEDRVMFGGDWPVVLEASPYVRWVQALDSLTAALSPGQKRKLWSENARRFYRL